MAFALAAAIVGGASPTTALADSSISPPIIGTPAAASSDSTAAPSSGTWVPGVFEHDGSSRAASQSTATPDASPDNIPGSGGSTCPGDAAKPGIYECLSNLAHNYKKGHTVFLRTGKSGTDSSGLGYVHALVDHNLDKPAITYTVYEEPAAKLMSNSRYQYAIAFVQAGEAKSSFVFSSSGRRAAKTTKNSAS